MSEKTDTLKREEPESQSAMDRGRREEVLEALKRLREIGESLPVVDAVAVVREGRDLAEQGSR